jgi:ATP-dependent protease ClpP protease subunit
LEKIDARVKEYVLKNSNITEQLYKEQEMHQWYMTSDEMLKYGLVDEIL